MDPNLNPSNSTGERLIPNQYVGGISPTQLRHDRAREVALHEARSALIPTMINTRADLDNYGAAVKGLAAAFLPFLLGEDKPNL